MMPKMLYERLDEIGTDFAVIYPTAGLRLPRIKDDETRRAVIRKCTYSALRRRQFRRRNAVGLTQIVRRARDPL